MYKTILGILFAALLFVSVNSCGSGEQTEYSTEMLDSLRNANKAKVDEKSFTTFYIMTPQGLRSHRLHWEFFGDSMISMHSEYGALNMRIGHKEGHEYKVSYESLISGIVVATTMRVDPAFVDFGNQTYYKYIAVPDVEKPAPTPSVENSYVVQKGDTYIGLAKRFKVNVDSLKKRNGNLLIGKKIYY